MKEEQKIYPVSGVKELTVSSHIIHSDTVPHKFKKTGDVGLLDGESNPGLTITRRLL